MLAVCFVGTSDAAPATQPTPPTAKVNLLAMGDWGTGQPEQKKVAGAITQYVRSTETPVDAMLLVGDNFYVDIPQGANDPVFQNVFENVYDEKVLNFPFYVALGNHDYQKGKDLAELGYSKAHPDSRFKLPARWYRVDFPAQNPQVTVLMLDSDKDPLSKAQWDEQKKWLDTELSKPRGTWTLCCAHHPLFSNGGHGDNGVLQNEWGPLLVKYKVDFFVCGHDHDLQHLQIPRWFTSFLLVGGGGADTKLMHMTTAAPCPALPTVLPI
jgi:tartrate-resistant acid phosphatase type 5